MPKPLLEQATLTESIDKKTGKILVDIVTPGIGSSGYYSPEVCEAAAGLVTAGTQMFLDHPTEAEDRERPIRSVKDIAAVFTESARWDPRRGEAGSLVAEAQVVPAWVETMEVIQGAIGVSLRGSATDIVEGEVGGRRMPVVEGLHAIDSVDFVTRAGRGGAFALMESARPSLVHQRAIAHGVSEATVNDTREALQQVLRETYGGEKTYVWVRDFDEETVWFDVEDGDSSGTYGQTYSQAASGAVELTGEWYEVRVQTSYVATAAATESVPVTRPDSTNPTTTESEEDNMGKIQIEESEHRSLVEKAGRVDGLVTENGTLKGENAQLRARDGARTRARTRVAESNSELSIPVVERIVEAAMTGDLPLTESGSLDEAAFDTRVDKARSGEETYLASLNESAGKTSGGLIGFGASASGGSDVAESKPTASPWGRDLSVKGA